MMEYKLGELEGIFEKIQEIIKKFEEINLYNKIYTFFLANNDRLTIKISSNNISHLLGINTDVLKLSGYYNGNCSYEVLKNFIGGGAYKLNKLHNEGHISYNSIFSQYINTKIDFLLENIKFSVNETEFVCKYNSERSFNSSDKTNKYDYIIVRKLSDDKYGVICLTKDNFEYVAMSNQVFSYKEELDVFLQDNICNQEITILNALSFKNNSYGEPNNFYLPLKLFIEKLNNARNIKRDFMCIVDTSSALEYHLKKYMASNKEKNLESENISSICDSLKSGRLIDTNMFSNEDIKTIIDSYNEFICNKDKIDTSGNALNYQKIKDELLKKSERIKELELEISNLKKLNEIKEEENIKLKNTVNDFEQTKEDIIMLLKKPEI